MDSFGYIDTHCHLNSREFEGNLERELELCRQSNVTRMVVVGCNVPDSRSAVEIYEAHRGAGLFPAVGIHPHDAKTVVNYNGQVDLSRLEELVKNPRVVALGEIGLDYHYDHSPRDVQRRVFVEQLALAKRYGKPVIFHVREAFDDFWDIVKNNDTPEKAVLHCFSGGWEDAKRALELGYKLGITGVVTYPKSEDFRKLVARLPEWSVLCETDCPYLAPVPYRGKTNRPAYVTEVYGMVAQVRGISVSKLAEVAWRNSEDLFELDVH